MATHESTYTQHPTPSGPNSNPWSSLTAGPRAIQDPPREIFKEELNKQIKDKKKVLLVRELIHGYYAPLTEVDLYTIGGMEYLKATSNRDPFDDLGQIILSQ